MMSAAAFVGTRFWWIRHAPVPVPPGTLVGRADRPCVLTDTDRLSALRRRVPQEAVLIASPLLRARSTAEAIWGRAPDRLVDDLMEQDFGDWDGKRWDEITAQADTLGFWRDAAATAPPGGESFVDQCDRVQRAVALLCQAYPDTDLAVVAHAGTIRAALALALGVGDAPGPAFSFGMDNLTLTRIDVGPGGSRIVCTNSLP